MAQLVAELEQSHLSFVRCIKPNAQLSPRCFDEKSVRNQLRCVSLHGPHMLSHVAHTRAFCHKRLLSQAPFVTSLILPIRHTPFVFFV